MRDCYETLYSESPSDKNALKNLSANIVTLDSSLSEDLDIPPIIEELDLAVKQLGKISLQASDGLTSEFYQAFWPILKKKFLSVLTFSLVSGSLPHYFRRAIITLLPKKEISLTSQTGGP